MPQIVFKNQFGEETVATVLNGGTDVNLPSEATIAAIAALGTVTVVDNTKASIDTALATIVAKVNAILAALKVQA